MESLYSRLGGEDAVHAIATGLYRRVLADEGLAPFFRGIDMSLQRRKFWMFLHMATAGPHRYSGLELRAAHERAVSEGMSTEHVAAFIAHLKSSMEELDLPSEAVEEAVWRVKESSRDVLGE